MIITGIFILVALMALKQERIEDFKIDREEQPTYPGEFDGF